MSRTAPAAIDRRSPRARGLWAVLVGLAIASTACTGSPDDPPPRTDAPGAPMVGVAWEEVRLPTVPGHRIAVRDATWCGDRWLVVGGVLGPPADSRPGAWVSSDGRRWEAIRFRTSTYWGARAVLSSVACRGGVPVAVGAMSGGAHGNPRVATFRETRQGAWVDVPAPVERYGGPSAVNVGDVAAGPRGWLISGNRRTGPAVWTARSPRRFHLVEGEPGLVGGEGAPLAHGAVSDGSRWTVVGGRTGPEVSDRVPVAWSSADGRRWRREEVPDTPGYDDLHRAARVGDAVVAIGLRGSGFGSWLREDGDWRAGGGFGTTETEARRAPGVASLTTDGTAMLTVVSDGARFHLWGSPDGVAWAPIELPLDLEATAEQALAVASSRSGVLLVADTGDGSRVWQAPWPGLGTP
ncbi:hypothetical protein HNR19_001547 [Nocardioides thalensis]|uniref:Exo-alpha-sialidase n=1 Tax=Nocardioides thalensis TaxID=1914755 RepID=A0A853C0F0_9ACTN|nr:hypothetical protein [Nocardioides thalensis]NYJ00849.1 hypothetical protein [Nocardioides thalensis]